MNFLNSFLKKDKPQQTQSTSETSQKPFVIKPKGKEINLNPIEEKKVKYLKKPVSFDFTFKVHGKSIFQNLVLTAAASSNGEIIPIKCKWKRVNNETVIYIKDINSFSYMPTAEDIGYLIEVEVSPIDDTPQDIAIAQYGPLEMDKDMKSAIELLLTSGQTHFNLSVFDPIEQEKVANKELMLYLTNDELKLSDIDFNRNEVVLERCRYSSQNPLIKLKVNDITRFTMKFLDFDVDADRDVYGGEGGINARVKAEYNLIAMSKQCRELIYLIIQFFVIDERMKNNKIFSLVNYNNLPTETKIGVTDLIGELKTLKEENTILMKNMKYLEFVNKKLNSDMKNLEEDFQITLEKINGADLRVEEEMEKNAKKGGKTFSAGTAANSLVDWKKRYDDINSSLTSLKAKEKALREEKKEFLLQEEINKNLLEKNKGEIKALKDQISNSENENGILNKNLKIVREENSKMKTEVASIKELNIKLSKEIETVRSSKNEAEKIQTIQSQMDEIKKQNEKLEYENKNLIIQRNLLSNQKSDLAKEFEKQKKENASLVQKISEKDKEIEALKSSLSENEKKISSYDTNIDKLKSEISALTKDYELLKIDNKVLQENYDKLQSENVGLNTSQMNQSIITSVKISPDEYEEYDQLRKDKDEYEATIMQLKSNNDAKDVEIQNLKMIIDSMKKE